MTIDIERRAAALPEYMPQLDGLRAIAVIAVMLGHFSRHDAGGPLGVRLFFALSGFLITRILLDSRVARESGVTPLGRGLRIFFSRRFLRLYPPLIIAIGLGAAFALESLRSTWGWHVTYLSNIYFARRGSWEGPVSPLWSLSVEEQFYLLWPFLVILVPYRRMVACICGVILSAGIFRLAGPMLGVPFFTLYVLPFNALDALGLGSLLAVVTIRPDLSGRLTYERLVRFGLYAGVAGLASLWALSHTGRTYLLSVALHDLFLSLIFMWAVGRAAFGFSRFPGRLLGLRPIAYLGRISYGIYLYHAFVGGILKWGWRVQGIDVTEGIPVGLAKWSASVTTRYPSKLSAVIIVTLSMSIAVGLASLSWFLVERPIGRLRKRIGASEKLRAIAYTTAPSRTAG